SCTVASGRVGERTEKKMMGMSLGFDLLYDGGCMPWGSPRVTRAIAVWTSCAAASIGRVSEKVSVTLTDPWLLREVICSMPGMEEKAFSSGVATDAAMVSGDAPCRLALTLIVG